MSHPTTKTTVLNRKRENGIFPQTCENKDKSGLTPSKVFPAFSPIGWKRKSRRSCPYDKSIRVFRCVRLCYVGFVQRVNYTHEVDDWATTKLAVHRKANKMSRNKPLPNNEGEKTPRSLYKFIKKRFIRVRIFVLRALCAYVCARVRVFFSFFADTLNIFFYYFIFFLSVFIQRWYLRESHAYLVSFLKQIQKRSRNIFRVIFF